WTGIYANWRAFFILSACLHALIVLQRVSTSFLGSEEEYTRTPQREIQWFRNYCIIIFITSDLNFEVILLLLHLVLPVLDIHVKEIIYVNFATSGLNLLQLRFMEESTGGTMVDDIQGMIVVFMTKLSM
ncbi:hypothetical protein ACJX0J_005948, partial [Zea mays]